MRVRLIFEVTAGVETDMSEEDYNALTKWIDDNYGLPVVQTDGPPESIKRWFNLTEFVSKMSPPELQYVGPAPHFVQSRAGAPSTVGLLSPIALGGGKPDPGPGGDDGV